jgi:hypothetical protein
MNTSGIFSVGLLSPQKLMMMQTVWFFLGIKKVGAAYSNETTLVKNPIDSNQFVLAFITC